MSNKTKNPNFITADQLTDIAQGVGITLMTAAVTLGLATDHSNGKIILPNQPAMALAGERDVNNNTMRREKETETAEQHLSFRIAQRTPARSGTQ